MLLLFGRGGFFATDSSTILPESWPDSVTQHLVRLSVSLSVSQHGGTVSANASGAPDTLSCNTRATLTPSKIWSQAPQAQEKDSFQTERIRHQARGYIFRILIFWWIFFANNLAFMSAKLPYFFSLHEDSWLLFNNLSWRNAQGKLRNALGCMINSAAKQQLEDKSETLFKISWLRFRSFPRWDFFFFLEVGRITNCNFTGVKRTSLDQICLFSQPHVATMCLHPI